MEETPTNLFGVLTEMKDQLLLLGFAGIAGGFFRAITAPETEIKRRIIQGLGGAISAIFLGGVMAQITNGIVDTGYWSFLAWGFIMGSGGEVAVKWVQERLMGERE
jgi:hypothetical protein